MKTDIQNQFHRHETLWHGPVRKRGTGLVIYYGWHDFHVSRLFIAQTDRGICFIGLKTTDGGQTTAVTRLKKYFPAATLVHQDDRINDTACIIKEKWKNPQQKQNILTLDLYGTSFQMRVWDALLKIPFGTCVSYADIARQIGSPKSSRAVGGAVGDNPISLIIPCHRVIQSSGNINNYGWGTDLKRKIIELESKS